MLAEQAGAQTYDTNGVVVQTFAGSGFSGYVDGVGQQTMFNNPNSIAADSSNNLFVLDTGNQRIRKITPDGRVSTFAGGGSGSIPGYGTNVSLNSYIGGGPTPMVIDRSNTLWFMRTVNDTGILRIRNDGYVTIVNLTGATGGSGLCFDSGNNLYYSDPTVCCGNKIYRWRTNGVLEVFAGSGNAGYADGNGIFTAFNSPSTLAADAADNIYVWDSGNSLIRRIDQSQNVTTFAGKYANASSADGIGTNAAFNSISQMCVDSSGNLLLA